MGKQARKPQKTARAVKVPKTPEVTPFRFIVFGDVHVDNARLDRALSVFDHVGDLAETHDARIVCVGDFWDLRGHWLVRHVEEVLKRVEAWRPTIFIPGNHDQVTLDGSIHGLNIFRNFEQHTVVTDPLLDEATRCAFIPWRERPDEQRALFDALDGTWTIFGHAEVGGAITNANHKTPGIVQVADIERVSRACYLGHYHRRQLLGLHTWYLGSPFAQNMGERDWPHGVALIDSTRAEPEFIEIPGMPKYWRLGWHDLVPSEISEHDVVELLVPPEVVGTEGYREALAHIPAMQVRPVVQREESEEAPPEFALTLDEAIAQHAAICAEESPFDAEELTAVGRTLLGEVPEARAIPPLGALVKLTRVQTRDFCALGGVLDFEIPQASKALIQAPIRTGKTAVLDAPMWCLYGETTPRKAGQQGASLRADAVINDAAQACAVECTFQVDDREIKIRREKTRGAGSRVHIEGIDAPAGISDQDAFVRHVVGLSHPLWRACVSLGQGAVGNFVTDADKRRKDLLSDAFGLEACPKAQKHAKTKRDAAQVVVERESREQAAAAGARDALAAQDFTTQAVQWDERRSATVATLLAQKAEAAGKAAQCTEALSAEATWAASKAQHDAHITEMTGRLSKTHAASRTADLQRQFGAIEAEKSLAVRESNQAREHYHRLVSAGAAPVCDSCGQALPGATAEQHLVAAEQRVRNAQTQLTTFDHRLANIAQELDALLSGGSVEQSSIEAAIAESRAALDQCATALAQFARIRANLDAAQQRVVELTSRIDAESAAANPFTAQAREVSERIGQLQVEHDRRQALAQEAARKQQLYDFWVEGFGPKGLPVLVLRTALYDLESAANRYLSALLSGTVHCRLDMSGDDLKITYYEQDHEGVSRERVYEQLSGGQRRCVELAFVPFALRDMIFGRLGMRVALMEIDELTTHLGAAEKSAACSLLDGMSADTSILAVDHDMTVQGEFDVKLSLINDERGPRLERV